MKGRYNLPKWIGSYSKVSPATHLSWFFDSPSQVSGIFDQKPQVPPSPAVSIDWNPMHCHFGRVLNKLRFIYENLTKTTADYSSIWLIRSEIHPNFQIQIWNTRDANPAPWSSVKRIPWLTGFEGNTKQNLDPKQLKTTGQHKIDPYSSKDGFLCFLNMVVAFSEFVKGLWHNTKDTNVGSRLGEEESRNSLKLQ